MEFFGELFKEVRLYTVPKNSNIILKGVSKNER